MNPQSRILLTILLSTILAAGGLVAAPQDEQEPQISPEEVQRLAQQVTRQVVRLSNYGLFDQITFGIGTSEEGFVVTLKGFASRPTLRKSAERVTAKIEGVEQVVNQIEVLPNSPNDDRIRTAVYVAVYGHPALSRYNPNRGTPLFSSVARRTSGLTYDPPIGYHPIHIIVKNGNVVLEDVVDTPGDKVIAGIQANQVFGVFRVDNDLVVANESMKKAKGVEKKK